MDDAELPNDYIARLRQGEVSLPRLPNILGDIQRELQKGNGLRQVAVLIEQDENLRTQVLRLANSAAYGRGSISRTVAAALVRVGVKTITNLIVAESQRAMHGSSQSLKPRPFLEATKVSLSVGTHHVDRRAVPYLMNLWRHELGAAIAAEQIAKHLGEKEPEKFFLAGLLHDIGKAVMLKIMRAPTGDDEWPFEAHLSALHAEAGSIVLEAWNLPEDVIAAVNHHHDPMSAGPHARMAAAVGMANRICHRVNIAPRVHEFAAEDPCAAVLGISDDSISGIESDLENQVSELNSVIAG